MVAPQLKAIFDAYLPLPLEVWENFEQLGQVEGHPREAVLKESNDIERHLSIILAGSGGNLIWKKNNFACIDIAYEKDFLCDYLSFNLQQPTPIEVRLFEDSTLFRLPYQQFQATLMANHYGEKITKVIAEAAFLAKQQQQIDLLTKTAKERYLEMMQRDPRFGRTPLKYLASYLGITPQSLSRIRAEKMQ